MLIYKIYFYLKVCQAEACVLHYFFCTFSVTYVWSVISVILGLSQRICGLNKYQGKQCRWERSGKKAAFSSSGIKPVCVDVPDASMLSFQTSTLLLN